MLKNTDKSKNSRRELFAKRQKEIWIFKQKRLFLLWINEVKNSFFDYELGITAKNIWETQVSNLHKVSNGIWKS